MSELAGQIHDRIRAMPRSIQWGIYAGAFFMLFFLWDSTVRPYHEQLSSELETIKSEVAMINSSEALANDYRSSQDAILGMGRVGLPTEENDGRGALIREVNRVRSDFTIKDDSLTVLNRGKVNVKTLSGIPAGMHVERIIGEFKFEAKSTVASQIIEQLEMSPDIESIQTLRLTKIGNDDVLVTLSLEAWIVAERRRRS